MFRTPKNIQCKHSICCLIFLILALFNVHRSHPFSIFRKYCACPYFGLFIQFIIGGDNVRSRNLEGSHQHPKLFDSFSCYTYPCARTSLIGQFLLIAFCYTTLSKDWKKTQWMKNIIQYFFSFKDCFVRVVFSSSQMQQYCVIYAFSQSITIRAPKLEKPSHVQILEKHKMTLTISI